jgi:hypothetical protein
MDSYAWEEMMYRVLFFWLLLCGSAAGSLLDGTIWINELHYDNDGADQNEFVEVVAPATFQDLSAVSLTLYNGGTGAAYGSTTTLQDFQPGGVHNGFAFYTLEVSMQNGAPDGLALARDNRVLQFLSYEGTFTEADGVAEGLLSTDLGVSEPATTPLGLSLQLGGKGSRYEDFIWQAALPHTLGDINAGQSLSAVPEPSSLLLWTIATGGPLLWWRRRRGTRAGRVPSSRPTPTHGKSDGTARRSRQE